MSIRDDEPFAIRRDIGVGVAGMAAGRFAADGMLAAAANDLRRRAESWAKAKGFAVTDGVAVHDVGGVVVRVPLYRVTEATARIETTALAPARASLTTERRVGVLARLWRAGDLATGDDAFDRAWKTRADDAGLARQLLDEPVRRALGTIDGWCRAAYAEGRIELWIDAEPMCGARVLEAIRAAAALAFVRTSTAAYR